LDFDASFTCLPASTSSKKLNKNRTRSEPCGRPSVSRLSTQKPERDKRTHWARVDLAKVPQILIITPHSFRCLRTCLQGTWQLVPLRASRLSCDVDRLC